MPCAIEMPRYGLQGYIHSDDHPPVHLHIWLNDREICVVEISPFEWHHISNNMPSGMRRYIRKVVETYNAELATAWVSYQQGIPFSKITVPHNFK